MSSFGVPLGVRRAFAKAEKRNDRTVVASAHKGLGATTNTIRYAAERGFAVKSQSQAGDSITFVFERE